MSTISDPVANSVPTLKNFTIQPHVLDVRTPSFRSKFTLAQEKLFPK